MSRQALLTVEKVLPWLSTVFPHAQGDVSVAPLAADASTRRYFRAQWAAGSASAPASCILMVCEPWDETDMPDFLKVGRHLRASGVRVSEVYDVVPSEGWMCLEDFGDRSLADAWATGSSSERMVWGERAMEALVVMHTTATQHVDPDCPAFDLAFDTPKLLSELQFFRKHAIEGLWGHDLTAADHAAFDAACEPLCARLAAQPRFFCHRDYHGWNVMAQDDTVGILDFQDARMGPQVYDVASLLTDRGTPQVLGDEVSARLISYYLDRFDAESGGRTDRDAFAEQFDWVAAQRCLKATGTFAAMHVLYQRDQYLPHIAPTLAYLRPLLERHEVLSPLAAFLRHYL